MERLPVELWDKIVSLCSRTDHTAMCQVSRDFQSLATQYVYRDIALVWSSQTLKCCRSIALRASNAAAVRSICFHSHSLPPQPPIAFDHTILAALSACSPNLLHLMVHTIYLDLTPFCFPLLQTFSVRGDVPITMQMPLFLRHHSTLTTLELQSTTIDDSDLEAAPIHVPRLLHFAGTNRIMDALVFGPSLRDIYIQWTPNISIAVIEKTLRAFALSVDSVRTFRSDNTALPLQFLDALSRTLPRISLLSVDLQEIGPNFMNDIGPVVCTFKELCSFRIHTQSKIKSSCEMLNDQVDILASWSSVMPHLRYCSLLFLTARITWIRIASSFWVPKVHKRREAEWWADRILSRGMDNRLKDLAIDMGWELHADGMMSIGCRNRIAMLPWNLLCG